MVLRAAAGSIASIIRMIPLAVLIIVTRIVVIIIVKVIIVRVIFLRTSVYILEFFFPSIGIGTYKHLRGPI